ncbi:voltage-gated potassium channel subunit beta-2 [Pimephales promelas]|nr:voltage-gated potassium channel subunit beta-2 [Pimephales promelas]
MMNFATIRALSGVHRGIRAIQKHTLHFYQHRNMSQSKLPVTLLGSMAFGGRADAHTSAQMVQVFLERGHDELDTAFMYNDGQAETIIGDMQLPSTVRIATKANPWEGKTLKPESVVNQLETSLKRLRTQCVDIFYLHAPDHQNPIQHTLEACNRLHQQVGSSLGNITMKIKTALSPRVASSGTAGLVLTGTDTGRRVASKASMAYRRLWKKRTARRNPLSLQLLFAGCIITLI